MRKVFPLVGREAVVRPIRVPDSTDQKPGAPDQPVKSRPLKSEMNPGSAIGAGVAPNKVWATKKAHIVRAVRNKRGFMGGKSSSKCSGLIFLRTGRISNKKRLLLSEDAMQIL